MVLDGDVARVRKLIKTDANARRIRDALHAEALKMLTEPPIEHKLIGPRLLTQSRRCLDRVSTLAALYRLEGDRRFAVRAEKEMLTAAAFADWNPKHFLDTAEMSNALGIGYDWLYDVLSPESRRTIRTAIVELGLKPGLKVYHKGGWWAASPFNWNQVCNGGLTVGALAIADEEPAISAEVVNYARKSIPLAMANLAPDGGWAEGPGYWNYATRYTAYYWAAMNTALGTDFGLKSSPGFTDTGLFRIQFIGPLGLTFNYADAGAGAGSASQMMYFARMFDRPVYAADEREVSPGGDAFELLWYDPRGSGQDVEKLPTAAWFHGINVVFMRSKWHDPAATFVGFKGGDNKANHSHLDLGTFVLDALGQRWVTELGPDDYNMPGYFGKQRWTYYRLKTEGQNTLVIDGENQEPKAAAPIVAFETTARRSFAIADLSAGYAQQAKRVRRGIALRGDGQVLVQDEIEAAKPADVVWGIHTTAAVKVDGKRATMTLEGKSLQAVLLSPADASWTVQEVTLEPPQRRLKNTRKLMVQSHAGAGESRIAVAFVPMQEDAAKAEFAIQPLDDWTRSTKR